MKPAIEWLEELEPGYRERALANAERFPKLPLEMEDSLVNALIVAFNRSATPEGYRFWDEVIKHYANALPPLPNE